MEMNETLKNGSELLSASPFADVAQQWYRSTKNMGVFNELLTRDAKIAQSPKQLVWTLNKAKLYRYVPRQGQERKHRIPLLLVFAVMNRPYVLDLRPGHSFVEYMIEHGYDVFLLDWGIPGLEDRQMKYDDYVLEYLPRVVRKLKSITKARRIQHAGLVPGGVD